MKTTEHLATTGEVGYLTPLRAWRHQHYAYAEALGDLSRPCSAPSGAALRYGPQHDPLAICTIPLDN